jgi:hypothetical protein
MGTSQNVRLTGHFVERRLRKCERRYDCIESREGRVLRKVFVDAGRAMSSVGLEFCRCCLAAWLLAQVK